MHFDHGTSHPGFIEELGERVLLAWPMWVVVGVCVGLAFGGEPVRLALRYTHAGIAAGQWWRLFTGNFVHSGWVHLAMDMAGVILLWILCGERLYGWRWLLATVTGSWAIGLGLWWAWPNVVWVLGISGVSHTYWAAGALLLIAARRWEGPALLVLLAGKLSWEQGTGAGLPTSVELLHGPVLIQAHLIGAIAGMVVGMGLVAFDYVRRRREKSPKSQGDSAESGAGETGPEI
ncbi:MAG: rhombosortase [Gammaproteobacteria bacterium]